ncbi:MAG: HutD family protein [Bacteroidota bacterium]
MFILPKALQHTTNWSGGTTTQLCVYPKDSTYAGRDFLFRISTATVETETSTFTSLPGFQRVLMILNGLLVITHQNHHTKTLHTFDSDRFDGGWETSAIGKVTDFNLMMAEGVTGRCKHQLLQAKQHISITVEDDFYGVYWLEGNAILRYQERDYILNAKDFIRFNTGETFTIMTEEIGHWVSVEVDYHSTIY